MRQGSVYVNNKLAGTIMEDENGKDYSSQLLRLERLNEQ